MGLHVEVRAQLVADHLQHRLAGLLRIVDGGVVEEALQGDVAEPDHVIGQLSRQPLAQPLGARILRRAGHHIGGGALQHGHMPGGVGHGRHQRHRRGPGADDHHLLAGIVQIPGPELRVQDLPLEVRLARELRPVPLGVVVIARAHVEEVAGGRCRRGVRPVGVADRPQGGRRVPGRRRHPVLEADVLVDAELLRRLLEIVQDGRAVGDGLGLGPRLEGEAQGVHVAVRADARIAEQVPGAAQMGPALEQRIGPVRTLILQVIGRADAGNPGADHQHVEVLHRECSCPDGPTRPCGPVRSLASPGFAPWVIADHSTSFSPSVTRQCCPAGAMMSGDPAGVPPATSRDGPRARTGPAGRTPPGRQDGTNGPGRPRSGAGLRHPGR